MLLKCMYNVNLMNTSGQENHDAKKTYQYIKQ